jgi:hypothetical protein
MLDFHGGDVEFQDVGEQFVGDVGIVYGDRDVIGETQGLDANDRFAFVENQGFGDFSPGRYHFDFQDAGARPDALGIGAFKEVCQPAVVALDMGVGDKVHDAMAPVQESFLDQFRNGLPHGHAADPELGQLIFRRQFLARRTSPQRSDLAATPNLDVEDAFCSDISLIWYLASNYDLDCLDL